MSDENDKYELEIRSKRAEAQEAGSKRVSEAMKQPKKPAPQQPQQADHTPGDIGADEGAGTPPPPSARQRVKAPAGMIVE